VIDLRHAFKRVFVGFDDRLAAVDGVAGVRSGIPSIDEAGGIHPEEILVLAGHPGTGKTSAALTMAAQAASAGTCVLYASLTESEEQVAERILANLSGVSRFALRRGQLRREDFTALTHAAAHGSKLPFHVEATPGLTASKLSGRIGALRSTCASERFLIVVDEVQMLDPDVPGPTRDYEVAAAVRCLSSSARELKAALVLVSQLNRRSSSRPDPRPQLTDLRDSGTLEASATAVVFLHRPQIEEGRVEAILAKHRHARVRVDELELDPASSALRPTSCEPPPVLQA
jgi:replicative DNA helicase